MSNQEGKVHFTRRAPLMIIAMKGHPGTGKSTLAHYLASSLNIPLIDKDDVRDCTLRLQTSPLLLTSPAEASALLNDLSYQVIWQIASTQLRLGLSVIVDSPLSRKAHLDRLVSMGSSAGARVVVVECKPSDEVTWRRRLEQRGSRGGGSWHKPSTWEDMERLLAGYGGCTEYDLGGVPRTVVDTTAPVGIEELGARVIEFINSHATSGCSDFPCPNHSHGDCDPHG